ncbi:MAG: SRPBCC domain-containing protein [Bryobacteraceae bacterium]|jgi:uncharacterized protein YndB with AHSA1/START domain
MTDPRPEIKGRTIRAEIRTSATPQQVWEAWTDPEKLAHWFTDKASGEARPGNTMTWFFDKFNYTIPYQILEALPPERLSMLFHSPAGDPGILEITIEHAGGETVMRLVNSGFRDGAEWDDEFEGTNSGWQMAVAVLQHYLENYFGEPRSSFLAMRPAEFRYEQLGPFFREASGLSRWLAVSATQDADGRYNLVFHDGSRLNGLILATTRREVALSWPEIRGVLELKAFGLGPGTKVLGVRGCGWSLDPARAAAIETQMAAALERLAAALAL